ncbi:uncharacterized protein B0T23DRAFT_394795 [Neurospora hispaniola]|uniref:Uncharacterized protein n=1 Tax=Neurospora hispaniola TaxID=588809 RepID=A0AAJ0I9X5_9PEZI|nr:hypothetical protein B0T23DRAFT_394795 [Neurospora hispaniola]
MQPGQQARSEEVGNRVWSSERGNWEDWGFGVWWYGNNGIFGIASMICESDTGDGNYKPLPRAHTNIITSSIQVDINKGKANRHLVSFQPLTQAIETMETIETGKEQGQLLHARQSRSCVKRRKMRDAGSPFWRMACFLMLIISLTPALLGLSGKEVQTGSEESGSSSPLWFGRGRCQDDYYQDTGDRHAATVTTLV